jgi:hypothetical protein
VIRNLSRAGFWREDACCCGAACFAEWRQCTLQSNKDRFL